MKIMAFNGSPRRNGNTAKLLKEALRGAAASGADTEYVDLYSLSYKGCISCFYCKRKDKDHGTCIVKDDLSPFLTKAKEADALLFGSPIYFMSLTSGMHAFLERLFFSNYIYSAEIPSVFGKKIPSAFIYTMNVTEEQAKEYHLPQNIAARKTSPTVSSAFRRRPFGPTIRCSSTITRNMNRRSSRKATKKPTKKKPAPSV